MTGKNVPISLILHTPGGLVLAAEQIAAALAAHPAKVTVYVPHYAMSGGTLIALAADRIVMAPSAVLGPVDPQVGDMPAASIIAAVAQKDPNEVDDRTLVMADVGRKAQRQVQKFVEELLTPRMAVERAKEVSHVLSEGRWTHDFPIDIDHARELGLPVSDDLPDEVRLLMSLYPQPRGRRPSVEYIPAPRFDGNGSSPQPRSPRRVPFGSRA
jgi:ClpP class serine protease